MINFKQNGFVTIWVLCVYSNPCFVAPQVGPSLEVDIGGVESSVLVD